MARPGKEQLFFLASAAVSGLLGALLFTDAAKVRPVPRGTKPDAPLLERKEVARAPRGPLSDAAWARERREAFKEPRDWLPLPAADLERPPLREPSYVPPPPRPSAGIDRLGLYRTQSRVTPHAFPDESAPSAAEPEETGPANAAAANAPKGTPGPAAGGAKPAAAPTPGSERPAANSAASTTDEEELKKRFDWIEIAADPKPWYGVIENADKFGLLERPDEPVKFNRRDPKTNRMIGSGLLARDRVKPNGIHLANTAANRTELLLRQHQESQWTASQVPALLDVIEQVMALGAEDLVAWRRAADHLRKYVALDPRHPRTYELLADALASLLDFEGELRTLAQAETAGVESPGLVVRRARWLARIGARAGALRHLAEGVARFPSDRGVHLAYGRELLAAGSAEEVALAVEQFQQAEQGSQTREQRMEVYADRGAARLDHGEAEAALDEAKRILNVDKGSALGFRLEGAAEFALGRFTDAEADFRRLQEAATSPEWKGEAALSLGLARTRLGDFDQARADLRSVTALQPLLGAKAAAGEAELLAVTDHLDAAVARCRDAVARAPDDAYLRYFLGRMLRRANAWEEAQAELRRALDLGATFPDLFNELGYLALLEGRAADARRYFDESLAREERDEARLMLAHAHLLAGELGPARTAFEALNARKPGAEALLGLAFCSYKRGESQAAQQVWQQVKEELPSAHADDKAYAAKWLALVLDLESKQVWEDTIEWRDVGNGWELDQRYGLEPKAPGGSFRLAGVQRQGTTVEQWSYLKRDVELAQFFEYEVDVVFGAEHQGRVGFGLAHFTGGATGQAPQVRASLLLALEPDGKVVLQHREHTDDAEWKPIGEAPLAVKAGETVTLALRRKERGSPLFQFFANGSAVGEPIEMAVWRGKGRQQVSALFFAAAPGGKKCDAELQRARRVEFLAAQ